MDLKKLDSVSGANEGFEGELRHPSTNAGLGMFVTVLGRDSDEFQRKLAEQSRRRLSKTKALGRFAPLGLDELEQDTIELLATCTAGWRDGAVPTLQLGEERLDCNYANAVRVYREFPWIREQIDTWISDRSNFLTASASS